MPKIQSIILSGTHGTIVDVECHLSNNLPTIVIVGFANKAVDEARERIRSAFASSQIYLPRKRITINLAPADIPKADSGFDLAIAAAILRADDQQSICLPTDCAFIGELGLDGTTRAVRGVIGKLLAGRTNGITTFFIPAANLDQARLVPDVTLVPVSSLFQLHSYLTGTHEPRLIRAGSGSFPAQQTESKSEFVLSEVAEQHQAKRALEIAAAGGHNLLFSGPPGTGKSMLAKSLASILPPLSQEEILEVTHLHSLASDTYDQIVTERPFRSPHHSASHAAMIGGGLRLRPGEISLSHRGVLFLDELPEFERDTIEALRQPLEDRIISLARAHSTADYPANFILVATANPCPCGYHGSRSTCHCSAAQILGYQHKLSGPILDRIDLYTEVHEVNHSSLLVQKVDPSSDAAIVERVQHTRQLQAERYGSSRLLNADMSNQAIKRYGRLTPLANRTFNEAARQFNLSARAYLRTLKVARTIADLDQAADISLEHLTEALAYRYKPPRSSETVNDLTSGGSSVRMLAR